MEKEEGGCRISVQKGVMASDPTVSEEEGAPPVVEVETGTTMGVGMAAGGGDEGRHHEGRVEMGEDEWIDGGGETHH